MYDFAILAFAAIAAVAAVLTVLPLLGFDIRIRGRQTVPLASTELRRTRKAWLALTLALLSLGLSAGAFYHFFRPKVVEKIVDRPVEKIVEKQVFVPQECPKPLKVTSKDKKVSSAPPLSQECAAGAKCAQSSNQTGGVTAAEYNNFAPLVRVLSKDECSSLQSFIRGQGFKVSISAMVGVSDAYDYAYQIRDCLKNAEVDVENRIGATMTDNPVQGIQVNFHGPSMHGALLSIQPASPAGIVLRALISANIKRGAHSDPNVPEGTVNMFIGKP